MRKFTVVSIILLTLATVFLQFWTASKNQLVFQAGVLLAGKSTSSEVVANSSPSRISTTGSIPRHPPTKGIVVVELLGRLANNLFQVAFARTLAKRLGGWHVAVIPDMYSALVVTQNAKCFPHALPPVPLTLAPDLEAYLNITETETHDLELRFHPRRGRYAVARRRIQAWAEVQNHTWFCHEFQCRYSEPDLSHTIQELRQSSSTTRLVHLRNFFVHYDWINGTVQDMRNMFAMEPRCCQTKVPPDVVVVHFRNIEAKFLRHNLTPNMLWSILKQYNYTHRPIWIVCEPESERAVKAFVETLNVTIHFGKDGEDAFCMLLQATTLIASQSSTFSQMAGLLGNATEVHYPLHQLDFPNSTIVNPNWLYHWIHEADDRIIEFNVDSSRIQPDLW